MTRKKPVEELKKPGRKKKPIDYKKVEEMAAEMCSYSEIAATLGVSLPTLNTNPVFLDTHKKGMERGKALLRSTQFRLAREGNPTMNIWLGKQYLGQSDKMMQEITGKGGSPVEVNNNAGVTPEAKELLIRLYESGIRPSD